MSSKSLPVSFKQSQLGVNQRTLFNNSSTISRATDTTHSSKNPAYSSSLSSSNVKTSSPLTRAWLNEEHTDSSDKSWLTRRWSTVSGSLVIKKKHKKKSAARVWSQRQKRRTFPPSTDILKQEQKKFCPELLLIHKSSKNRQSLADVLSAFQCYDPSPDSTSSSSLSRRFGRILKKKGKQPIKQRKPRLNVHIEQKSAMAMFQPPPTISSGSSSPSSSPLKFPTPPKRFSAFFVDSQGRSGKVGYKRPSNSHSKFLNLIYHGISLQKPEVEVIPSSAVRCKRHDKQLCINALLFISGFLFFPFWWVGAWFYFYKKRPIEREEELCENDLFSIKTFAYLNGIFSCISFVFSFFIIALIIWMIKES
jgi:hypothetical protein